MSRDRIWSDLYVLPDDDLSQSESADPPLLELPTISFLGRCCASSARRFGGVPLSRGERKKRRPGQKEARMQAVVPEDEPDLT